MRFIDHALQEDEVDKKRGLLAACWQPTRDHWCERGDSNPHGFPRQILSLVRLPIPPLSHGCTSENPVSETKCSTHQLKCMCGSKSLKGGPERNWIEQAGVRWCCRLPATSALRHRPTSHGPGLLWGGTATTTDSPRGCPMSVQRDKSLR